jgi:NADP-dependent 3-hydroxy acid dehydrogenase YdfG
METTSDTADVSRTGLRLLVPDARDLSGKAVLVTGGTTGIGRATADLEMLHPEDVAGSILYALLQPERCDVVSIQIRPHRQVI